MASITFQLDPKQLADLNARFPPTDNSSSNAGKRAVEIVRLYFVGVGAQCVAAPRGHDIEVAFPGSTGMCRAEVKGTRDDDVAFGKLRVSSSESYRLLTSDSIPLLRVAKVFSATPVIHELFHGQDFTLVNEPRWRIVPIAVGGSKAKKTPKPRSLLIKSGS